MLADDLLPERALAGDELARGRWWRRSTGRCCRTGTALLETLSAFLEQTSSLEATARVLFVHPNTVRYRLRRVAEVTGYTPSDPRHAFTLRLALTLGRLAGRTATDPAGVVGNLQRRSRSSSSGSAPPARAVRPKGWTRARHRRSRSGRPDARLPPPWLELPHFEDRLRWLSACAGLDLVHYGTEADADTIRDTAVAQPLLVAAGLVVGAGDLPAPGRRVPRRRRDRRATASARSPPPPAPASSPPSRRWCWSASAAGRWPTPRRSSRPA